MAHLISLSAVLELSAAVVSVWTETNPLVLVATLSMGAASTTGAFLRAFAALPDEKEWEDSLARANQR